MPLRVAFDLDGTLADMQIVLRREAEQLFGDAYRSPSVEQSGTDGGEKNAPENVRVMAELHLTVRQQTRLWEHVKTIENFWSGLPEMEPGIVARLARIAAERRWEVIFLTTRPAVAGDTVQIQSQRWLEAQGFRLPSVFVVRRSRGKAADALELDAVVDDRAENCLDVAMDSKARPILVWPSDPQHLPPGAKRLGVRVVTSIAEALDLVVKLDDLKNETGVVRSLKRLFGRETTT